MDFSLFEDLFEAVLVIDENFRIVYANRSAKEIIGERLKGKECKGLFSICKSCPFEYVKEDVEGVQVYDTTLKNSKHVCWSMSPLYEGGKFVGVVEVFKDVSNVVHCIIEAERQRTYKETILNSIVEAILVLDTQGNVVEHNQVASTMLCREEGEILVGKNIRELINLSLEELPPEGERSDIYVETPCGRQRASLLISPMASGFGYVVSLYVIKDIGLCQIGEEDTILTKSPAFQRILDTVKTVAEYDVNVLLEGETGTGKSLLAKYIHYLSPRRDKPLVRINCSAIPETLLEAELFGYVKGAFTNAIKDKPGKVELAEGGTLLLDEMGDMSLSLQAKILHLVQEKEFERLGDTRTRKANIRIIASTNKNLKELIKQGQFREDLYYRLSVVKIHLPPLRDRKEDIPMLVSHFIEKYSRKYSRRIKGITSEAVKLLLSHDFPGNVRELENLIEHAVITCKGSLIKPEDIPLEKESKPLEEMERIRKVLEEVRGNKSLAAKILGIHRTTLWRKLREFGIG